MPTLACLSLNLKLRQVFLGETLYFSFYLLMRFWFSFIPSVSVSRHRPLCFLLFLSPRVPHSIFPLCGGSLRPRSPLMTLKLRKREQATVINYFGRHFLKVRRG